MLLSDTNLVEQVEVHIPSLGYQSMKDVPQPHTASIRGNRGYSGNSRFWQGKLLSGTYTFTVQTRSGVSYYHYVAGPSYEEYTRAVKHVKKKKKGEKLWT